MHIYVPLTNPSVLQPSNKLCGIMSFYCDQPVCTQKAAKDPFLMRFWAYTSQKSSELCIPFVCRSVSIWWFQLANQVELRSYEIKLRWYTSPILDTVINNWRLENSNAEFTGWFLTKNVVRIISLLKTVVTAVSRTPQICCFVENNGFR